MSNLIGTKVTQKGTELPLLNLKGKPYLQVAHRLVWFREEYPLGRIVTEIVSADDSTATVKATIAVPNNELGAYMDLSSGFKSESADNFPDFLEKAETGAVGRALAMAGFGTQFEPELDEQERLADSPVAVAKKKGVANGNSKDVGLSVGDSGVEQAGSGHAAPVRREGPAAPAIPRETVNKTISTYAKVIQDKKLKSKEELKALVASAGAPTKEALTDAQALELLSQMKQILA